MVYVALWRNIVKPNKYVTDEFREEVKNLFKQKKAELLPQFVNWKLSSKRAKDIVEKNVLLRLKDEYLEKAENKEDIVRLVRDKVLDLMVSANQEHQRALLYNLIQHYSSNLEDSLSLVEKHFYVLNSEPARLLDEINEIMMRFEAEEDITATVITAKLNK